MSNGVNINEQFLFWQHKVAFCAANHRLNTSEMDHQNKFKKPQINFSLDAEPQSIVIHNPKLKNTPKYTKINYRCPKQTFEITEILEWYL